MARWQKKGLISKIDEHQFLEFRPVDISQEGGGGLRETSMARFWLQNQFVSLPSVYTTSTR